jgi:transcriptional regulator with XRE-family HTH domain
MSLLENIQFLCKQRNISVPKLEKEIGLGNGAIYKWGVSSPTVDKLQKVADFFKVSTEYLLLGYERVMLVSFINSIRGERSYEKFSKDTGVDIDELTKICLGLILERPSLETIERIANSTLDFIPQRELDRGILLRVAGYRTLADIEEDFKDTSLKDTPATIVAHHDKNEWTEEELVDIERFKEFIRSKRNKS